MDSHAIYHVWQRTVPGAVREGSHGYTFAMITKREVATQLAEAARLLDVLSEDRFRARAYRAAARQLGTFEGDLVELTAAGRLTDIRGVGSGLAGEIQAALERGELAVLEDLRARVPEGVRDLFRVSGLGARKVAQLWDAGIGDLKALVRAAAAGQVAALKGFGAKSAENILAGARFALQAKQRMRLDEADTLAAHALRVLRAALPDATVMVAGELRRGLETIGGLDLIVTGAEPAALTRAVIQPARRRRRGDLNRCTGRVPGKDHRSRRGRVRRCVGGGHGRRLRRGAYRRR